MEINNFIKFSSSDRIPGAPALSLELWGRSELSLNLAYPIHFTISRGTLTAVGQSEPISLLWSAYSTLQEFQIVVLHQTENGLEKVDFEPDPFYKSNRTEGAYIERSDLTEIHPNGTEIRQNLPGLWHKSLRVGEKYIMLWPGAEIKWWNWGSTWDNEWLKLEDINRCPRPRIILPASNSVYFTVCEKPEPSQLKLKEALPTDPTFSDSDRIPGAPVISVSLRGPSHYSIGRRDNVSIIFTYHENTENTNSRPIVFQHEIYTNMVEDTNISFLHHSSRGLKQMHRETGLGLPMCSLEENWGPKDLLATKEVCFLAPGESSIEHTALWDYEFEDGGFEVGEKYTFRYDGGEIPWWNWGTKEEYMNRKIPIHYEGYRTIVDEPPSQTPKIILPASNDYEFIVVE